MKILNLGCGSVRPQGGEFVNMDNLRAVLAVGTPERTNLDAEGDTYVNGDIAQRLPFDDESFDSCMASHVIEHFDCQQGVAIMLECHRILKPGGVLLVSVPDASVFRRHHAEDTPENAIRLFGEPIHMADGESTFANYALWNRFHRAILTEDALWAYFVRAGFDYVDIECYDPKWSVDFFKSEQDKGTPLGRILQLLNRLPFSLIMAGTKL